MDAAGVDYEYEPESFPLTLAVPGHQCSDCRSTRITRVSRYTPDFLFKQTGIYVEAKGKFTAKDRKRCLAFADQQGDKFRMVFMRNNRLTKGSKTYYTDWASKHGIICAVGRIPEEWYRA